MTKNIYLTLIACFISIMIHAQATHRCATTQYWEQHKLEFPETVAKEAEFEKLMDLMENSPIVRSNARGASIITIPVVVHVVYTNNAQNISTARINSQIERLNKDFNKLNNDTTLVPTVWKPLIADVGIEFALAVRDPQGNATTGILRVPTTSSFNVNNINNVKSSATGGSDIWDRNSYLNLYVCNISGGILGISQFPNGSATTDAIAFSYQYFGDGNGTLSPYNKGRTATHEVGHWFNLRHIWGDDGGSCSGSDFVADTPNQGGENYGCFTFPLTDNCTATGNGVMFMNYMDYTDDACMYFFTTAQKTRMLAALNGPRSQLFNSLGLVPPTGLTTVDIGNFVQLYPNPAQDVLNIDFNFNEVSDVTLTLNNIAGQVVFYQQYNQALESNQQIDISSLNAGIYFAQIKTNNGIATKRVIIQ